MTPTERARSERGSATPRAIPAERARSERGSATLYATPAERARSERGSATPRATRAERARSERGSATLHAVFVAVLLFTALGAAVLWAAISTARHKLAAAADLTALSAAHALVDAERSGEAVAASSAELAPLAHSRTASPCVTAARTAALNDVRLTSCEVTSVAVTVVVSLRLDLRMARPTLTASARAGPL